MGARGELAIRVGGPGDYDAIFRLWDAAIEWLVACGQTGQWGVEPISSRPTARKQVELWVNGENLRIAELDGEPVGVCVIDHDHPAHVAPVTRPERYIGFLLSSRQHAHSGIGAELVREAVTEARASGAELLRVDCWAGAPTLVGWYETQGFVKAGSFDVKGWIGQVFEMQLV